MSWTMQFGEQSEKSFGFIHFPMMMLYKSEKHHDNLALYISVSLCPLQCIDKIQKVLLVIIKKAFYLFFRSIVTTLTTRELFTLKYNFII